MRVRVINYARRVRRRGVECFMVLLDFGFRRGTDRAVSGRVGAVGIWSAVTVVKVAGGGGRKT